MPRILVNVTWGIWALMDLADTVSDMVTECYLIGAWELAKGGCLGCLENNCYLSNDDGAQKSNVQVSTGDHVDDRNARNMCY